MEIRIVCVGSLKEKFWVDAVAEYEKRLGAFCKFSIIEVKEYLNSEKSSEILITKKKEADSIKKYLKGYVVALEINGKSFTSEIFAKTINEIAVKGQSCITFLIGGSNGLDTELSTSSNLQISFGNFTYPHQLMRVILCEQIYRAFTIINNKQYHK